MRERLNPGGVACIWVQGFNVSPEVVRTLTATFRDVFPHMDLWESRTGYDYLLTGYTEPTDFDRARIEEALSTPSVRAEAQRMFMPTAADFLGYHIASGDALSEWIDGAARNTDDRTILEQMIPRAMYTVDWTEVVVALEQVRQPTIERVASEGEGDRRAAFEARLTDIHASKSALVDYRIAQQRAAELQAAGRPTQAQAVMREVQPLIQRVRALNPLDWWVVQRFGAPN